MSANTNGSNTSLSFIRRTDIDYDDSSIGNRQKDHAYLKPLINLLKKDDLDSHIYDIVHNIVHGEFLAGVPPYDYEDIPEII